MSALPLFWSLSIVPGIVMLALVVYGLVLLTRMANSLQRIADAADRRGPSASESP